MDTESIPKSTRAPSDHMSTLEAARVLGLAVRSVQLMVDRGELEAWKTPGGHRRISRRSVDRWIQQPGAGQSLRHAFEQNQPAGEALLSDEGPEESASTRIKALLIEDSVHFQNLVSLLVRQKFPEVDLHVAGDGITGLVMAGKLQPDILMIDILLPGIDGAALIASLRSHAHFQHSQLIVVTSLDESQRKPYAFTLQDIPIVHKPHLVADLPPLLVRSMAGLRRTPAQAA